MASCTWQGARRQNKNAFLSLLLWLVPVSQTSTNLLPLKPEPVTALAYVRHTINIVRNVTQTSYLLQVSICDCETAPTMFVPMGIQGHGMDVGCFHIEQVLRCLPAFEGTVNRRKYMTTPILTLLEELFLFHWFFVVAVVFVCCFSCFLFVFVFVLFFLCLFILL